MIYLTQQKLVPRSSSAFARNRIVTEAGVRDAARSSCRREYLASSPAYVQPTRGGYGSQSQHDTEVCRKLPVMDHLLFKPHLLQQLRCPG